MSIKQKIAKRVLPLARLYIRHSPFNFGKLALFKRFGWRDIKYRKRTKFGATINGSSADVVQGYIYYFGIWEPNLTAFICSRLEAHSERTFVDVGANVGYFTLLAASYLVNGNVVAIEAFPAIFEKLRTNVSLNRFNNIRLIEMAVTDKECDVSMFHAGPENEGATTSVAGKFEVKPIMVRGDCLSNLLTEQEIKKIKLIKIDVEGAEYSVVIGMAELIKNLPFDAEVIIEITPTVYAMEQLLEVFEIFRSAQFLPYCLENPYEPDYYIQTRKPLRPVSLRNLPTKQTDVVFSRTVADTLV